MLRLNVKLRNFLFLCTVNGISINVIETSETKRSDSNETETYTHSIIFFHGVGDTGEPWNTMFNELRLPNTHIVVPTAEKIALSISKNKLDHAWFDFKGVRNLKFNDEKGIEKAIAYAHSLIDDEIRRGIPSYNILIGGFSQGGGLALLAGLKYSKKLAGIMAFSTWLPLYEKFSESWVTRNRDIRIHVCQCKSVIPVRHDSLILEKLRRVSKNVTLKKLYSANMDKKLANALLHKVETNDLKEIFEFIKTSYFIQQINRKYV